MTSPQDFLLSTFHKSATDFTGLSLRTTEFSGRLGIVMENVLRVMIGPYIKVVVIKYEPWIGLDRFYLWKDEILAISTGDFLS